MTRQTYVSAFYFIIQIFVTYIIFDRNRVTQTEMPVK